MDDSDFIASSLEPSKKLSKRLSNEKSSGLPPKKFVIESDCLLPDAEESRCYVCNKDLHHLDELRKALHINNCLDQQEAKNKYELEKETWSRTVDCPLCGTPLQPGPFRAAHAKSCGRKHEVSGAQLLSLMEAQTKVADVRKKNGLSHTKMDEPKLVIKKPSVRKDEPRTEFDEQMKIATALSASLDSSAEKISVPEPRQLLKSRKLRPRSYSFVELEPRSCKCSVFEEVQRNFLQTFKVKRPGDFVEAMRRRRMRTSLLLGDINKCIRKLERLERLADDLNRFGSLGGDVTIFSLENEPISVHRFIIAARAPLLLPMIGSDGSLPLRDYSAAALRCYVCFLYSSAVEWTESERTDVLKLASQYGPAGLASLCRLPNCCGIQEEKTWNKNSEHDFEVIGADIAERDAKKQEPLSLEDCDLLKVGMDGQGSSTGQGLAANIQPNKLEPHSSGSVSETSSNSNEKGNAEQERKSDFCLKNIVKLGGEGLLDTICSATSSTVIQTEEEANIRKEEDIKERKEMDEDSDGSVVFVSEIRGTNKPITRGVNMSEDWEVDSGAWLEDLLPVKNASLCKTSDGGKDSGARLDDLQEKHVSLHETCGDEKSTDLFLDETGRLKSMNSGTLMSCRSPGRNPEVREVSFDGKNCGNGSKYNLMLKEASIPNYSDGLASTPIKESSLKGYIHDLELNSPKASKEENKRVTELNVETERGSFFQVTDASLNESFDYSPLPLPIDSFYDEIESPLGLSPDREQVRENSGGPTDLLIGSGSGRKHKSVGCLPSTSATAAAHEFSFVLDADELRYSFFDSPLAEPMVSTSLQRSHSDHLSEVLCSPPQAKYRRTTLQESPKCSRKRGEDFVQDETVRFGIPLFSPIRKSEAQPCCSRMSTKVGAKTNVQYCSTPNLVSTRLAQRLKELGSNVKVLKTSNITPLPDFAQMNDKQLKDELAKYGVRPMGRKRAIALLKKIYDELHPVIDNASPLSSKPKRRMAITKLANRLGDLEDEEGSGDKTLNKSLDADDILEESCIDMYDEDAPLPKDLDGMQIALLAWLRREDNADLYNTLLALNPIAFEKFSERLRQADTAVAKISKKALMEILDRLHITFSLPSDGWKRRREKKQKLRAKK